MRNEIEKYLIACIWADEKLETVKLDELNEEMFSGSNRELFKKVIVYRKQGRPYDVLEGARLLGQDVVTQLMPAFDKSAGLSRYSYYLSQFKKDKCAEKIVQDIQNCGEIEQANLEEYLRLSRAAGDKEKLFNLNSDLQGFIDAVDQRVSGNYEKYSLGIHELDETLGYVRPGTLITVGARTSVGKTNFCLKLMSNVLKSGVKCLFLSSEMGYHELIERLTALNSNLSLWDIRNGRLSPGDVKALQDTLQEKIYNKPGHIYELSKFDIQGINELIDRLKVKVIFVDYLQRFNLGNKRNETRASILSDIVNELKAIALDKKVIIIAASQLTRATQNEEKPGLHSLKESGGIEEASDVVILLSQTGETEYVKLLRLDIAKNRQGVTREFEFCMDRRNCDIRALGNMEREVMVNDTK
jgi:replicative DNA helicase